MNKFDIMRTRFSYFDAPLSNVIPSREITVDEIIRIIRKDLALQTFGLRSHAADKEAYARLKRTQFPYVTFSGLFQRRSVSGLVKHSGLICIDLDHLGTGLDRVRQQVMEDLEHVVLSFISPGGDGLKVVYPIDLSIAPHEKWVRQYQAHLRKLTGMPDLKVDTQCSDIARACIVPHDKLAFLNPMLEFEQRLDVVPIEFAELPEDSQTSYESYESWRGITPVEGDQLPPVAGELDFKSINSDENFLRLCQMNSKHAGPYGRPRNPWIQKLASRCNLLGMDQRFCESAVVKYFSKLPTSHDPTDPLNIKEHFINPIRSTYRNYRSAHGTWTSLEMNSFETPELPAGIYSEIPELLLDGCKLFTEPRERDLFLLGLLTVISACMPNVRGRYSGRQLEANLFLMVIAPAASGKGNLRWALSAVKDILARSREDFERESQEYEKLLESAEGPKPKKPSRKSLLIPGNISAPAIIQALDENGGRGLIFETEADTVANTMQNDWGNYSDILRKAFHHEYLSLRRRHENEQYALEYPCLSVALSGTPNQVRELLQSAENGFFSRILFYDFKSSVKWKDPFAEHNDAVFVDFMEARLPQTIRVMYDKCNALQRVEFSLSSHQQHRFNVEFNQWLLESEYMIGDESIPTIKRLGVILFRIAMILTTIRNLEILTDGQQMVCSDADFETSLQIVDSLRLHAFKLISGMKRTRRGFKGFSNDQQKNYYLYLPTEFTRREADSRAKAIRLNAKTAEKYLEDYRNSGLLEHIKHGEYRKTKIGLQIAA